MMKSSYCKVVGLAGGLVRKANHVMQDLREGRLPVTGNSLMVVAAQAQLEHFVPLVKKVVAPTKARALGGDTHVVGKILSLSG